MLVGTDVALDSGRGHLKVISALDGIKLIKKRIDGAVHLLAILNAYSVFGINGNLEMVIRTYLGEGYIPYRISELLDRRCYRLSYGFLYAFLHNQILTKAPESPSFIL